MYDAHVRAFKRHLKVMEARALLAAVDSVRNEWRSKMAMAAARAEGYRERKWLT